MQASFQRLHNLKCAQKADPRSHLQLGAYKSGVILVTDGLSGQPIVYCACYQDGCNLLSSSVQCSGGQGG